jgi:hypothetical protein
MRAEVQALPENFQEAKGGEDHARGGRTRHRLKALPAYLRKPKICEQAGAPRLPLADAPLARAG